MLVLAIILGIVVGLIAVVPFPVAQKLQRKHRSNTTGGLLGWFAFAIIISFVIIFATVIACKFISGNFIPDEQEVKVFTLAYSITAIVIWLIGVFVFGLIIPKIKDKKG